MVVIHGTWVAEDHEGIDGRFFVWGESLASSSLRGGRGRPSKQTSDTIPSHPFQASEQELIDALRELTGGHDRGIPLAHPGLERLQLLLPTKKSGIPLPSPEFRYVFGDVPEDPLTLSLWGVNGLVVSPVWVVNALIRLEETQTEPVKSSTFGNDLRFWSRTAKLALELLVRERFIPTVAMLAAPVSKRRGGGTSRGGSGLKATWLALLDQPEDTRRVAILAANMPAVCRAISPVAPPPKKLVEGFLHAAVDGMARHWLASMPMTVKGGGVAGLSGPERWVNALCSEKAVIRSPLPELGRLQEGVDKWTAEVFSRGTAAEFRTCFRLEPPDEQSEDEEKMSRLKQETPAWFLRFMLQANDDPSLMVPAEKVWRESKSVLRFLNRKFANPQERLLADLARAARVFPPIEESLRSASPEGCYLTSAEAYCFLREAATLLTESGFGVMVPPWWGQGGSRLGVRLRVKPQQRSAGGHTGTVSQGMMGLDVLVSYDWEVALGSEVINRREFERLASLKVPLVRIRGRWVELRPEEVEAASRFWERQQTTDEMTLREALRLGLAGGTTLLEAGEEKTGPGQVALPVTGVEAEGWIAPLLEKLKDIQRIELLSPPVRFHGNLRPYQVRGYSWLHFLTERGMGACLADDMGLGKTIQFIALLLHRRAQGLSTGPVLLICPTSVAGNWQREVARFAPSLRMILHHGSQRLSGRVFTREVSGQDLVITTYTLAHRDANLLAGVTWEGVVLDEAQNIKNPEAKQSKSIRGIKAGYKIALTGTPVENRLSELWSIMEFLNPGFLGNLADFRTRFSLPIERYRDPVRAAHLQRLVQPFILRRVKNDPQIIQDLPEKQEMKVFCHLTREQATLYEAVVKDMMHQIEAADGIQRKGLVLTALTKLKQVCNHPAQLLGDGSSLEGRSGKLVRLDEMLEEVLAAGDRAIIFTQFAEMGGMLQRYLQVSFGREVLFLHGGVARSAREQMVRRFQEEKHGPSLFILSLKAGGVGLNLTRANHVFHFDRWWNPAVENQATDRAFRIGQVKNVQVHKFLCAGTLEERIDEMIEKKRALAEEIIGTGEAWLTEMSTQELREALALQGEVVDME
ncbi:hypothetical protein SY88_21915 [Clostridiales bacterium PH28_bin88]|nr:hypothetical protein SY88_21915 [Clostridiales bacterium PH28_bin88]